MTVKNSSPRTQLTRTESDRPKMSARLPAVSKIIVDAGIGMNDRRTRIEAQQEVISESTVSHRCAYPTRVVNLRTRTLVVLFRFQSGNQPTAQSDLFGLLGYHLLDLVDD